MKKIVSTIFILCACLMNVQGQKDSAGSRFSYWAIRVNPFSPFEQYGGIQLGVETNIDKKNKWNLVSEFGYVFINNVTSPSGKEEKSNNANKLTGFKTRQEVRWVVKTRRQQPVSYMAVEGILMTASIPNRGWFGIDGPDDFGNYAYFKYQDFKEQVTELGAAIKFVHKVYLSNRQVHNLELFGGFGLFNRMVKLKNPQGVLVQPDNEVLVEEMRKGVKPYLAAGIRLNFVVRK